MSQIFTKKNIVQVYELPETGQVKVNVIDRETLDERIFII